MRFLALAAAASLAGCGYVGEPKPPALNIPQPVLDLTVAQRGARLIAAFHTPSLTTEGLGIAKVGEIELRYGPPPAGAFDVNAWAAAARRAPANPAESTLVQVEAPAADLAGKEVFVAVRTAHAKGRWSDWSSVVTLNVLTALATPSRLQAESSANGVQLSWNGDAPEYIVFRQAEGEKDFRMLLRVPRASHEDTTAQYGKRFAYQVTGVRKNGERDAESDISGIVEITPVDTFPPAVPQGLSALAGVTAIELAWERNLEKDFKGYYVYRSSGGSPFERISELTAAPSFSDKNVEAGKPYRYAVTSVDQLGNESAKTAQVPATLPQ